MFNCVWSRCLLTTVFWIVLIRRGQCAFEVELLDPELQYSNRMYTTDEGDNYIIIYNEHDGLPIGVEPYFPATVQDPTKACRQLYVYNSGANIPGTPEMSRVVHSLRDDQYMAPVFQSRNFPPREGLRFGCEIRNVNLDGVIPYRPNSLRWFMSCDPFRDQYEVWMRGSYPWSEGWCNPLDPEREQKALDAKEERERKRKSRDPDDEDSEPDRENKYVNQRSALLRAKLRDMRMYGGYPMSSFSMGNSYAEHSLCKDF